MEEASEEDQIAMMEGIKHPLLVKKKHLEEKIEVMRERQRQQAKGKESQSQ